MGEGEAERDRGRWSGTEEKKEESEGNKHFLKVLICDSLVNMFLFSGEKIYSDKFIQSHKAVSQWLKQVSNSVLLDPNAPTLSPIPYCQRQKAQIWGIGERMSTNTIYKKREQEREKKSWF